jgi:diaminopimelate epimerase
MLIEFYKYHGTGNDFVIVDNRADSFSATREQIALLCHRRFGIGSDGLMLLNNSSHADFEMKYYNSDGNPSSMCGNGGRCIVAFAARMGLITKKTAFIAPDGMHEAVILNNESDTSVISLKMADVASISKVKKDYILNTGSPHFVRFVNDVSDYEVVDEGRSIRYFEDYSLEGINVNFVSAHEDYIFVRTYERGVEDETLSCGTGVTAASLAWATVNELDAGTVNVHTNGGNLKVSFEKHGRVFSEVFLEGPAQFVFKGTIEIDD